MNSPESPQLPPASPPASSASPPPLGKKNPWPWIVGGCGCLTIIAVIAVFVAVGIFSAARKTQSALENVVAYQVPTPAKKVESVSPPGAKPALDGIEIPSAPGAGPAPVPSPKQSPPVVPAGWQTYTNTKASIPARLREHFVGFSFSYPAKFEIVPGESNFIKIEESLADPTAGNFTLENLAVGYITASPGVLPGMDQDLIFPMLMEQLSAQFAKGFANYKEIAQVPEDVAGLRGRALLFEAEIKGTDKGDVKFYGKTLLAREQGKEKGVAIIMLATSLDPDVKGPADVGGKGDLAPILR